MFPDGVFTGVKASGGVVADEEPLVASLVANSEELRGEMCGDLSARRLKGMLNVLSSSSPNRALCSSDPFSGSKAVSTEDASREPTGGSMVLLLKEVWADAPELCASSLVRTVDAEERERVDGIAQVNILAEKGW